jgi:type II pantothenate kinase
MSPFIKLRDPSTYVACAWDLAVDPAGREYWLTFFKKHLHMILSLGVAASTARGESMGDATARAERCRAELVAHFDDYAANPESQGRVTILTLDEWRDTFLRKHGFDDAFVDLKDRENERMLPLLPVVCAELDRLSGSDKIRAIIEGVFAGNIFDMGAEATARQFAQGSPDFFTTRATLARRPWLIDDYDALEARLLEHRHRKCVFFIDNAGSDFLLGALPMMRWLAMRGTHVVLAANERPTLNDMTVHDVNHWWGRICEVEPSIRNLPIERVTSGTGEPLIDLSKVSDDLNAAAEDADLVIMEGMGRGVESNLHAEFSCESVNLAMLKDVEVAKRIGGKLYDCVCRYRGT